MRRLIFVNYKHMKPFGLVFKALAWVALVSSPFGLAEGVPFRESTTGAAETGSEGQGSTIAQLKQRAVISWLQSYLGDRFPQVEKHIGKDFGEKYILDYQVGKSAENKTQVEIKGSLDANGLKRWLNLLETRAKGNSTATPLLVLSSSAPGLTILPSETPARASDSQLGQAIVALGNPILQKFNGKLIVGEVGVSTAEPPKSEREVRDVASSLSRRGQSLALWFHLAACKTCGGYRLDTHLLQLNQGRRALARSDDLALSSADLVNGVKLRAALKQPFTELQAELEELISSGALSGNAYALIFENVPNYESYKTLEKQISALDYLIEPTFSSAQAGTFSMDVMSPLGSDELMQRITTQVFTGFSLKRVSVDSRKLVVRYSK